MCNKKITQFETKFSPLSDLSSMLRSQIMMREKIISVKKNISPKILENYNFLLLIKKNVINNCIDSILQNSFGPSDIFVTKPISISAILFVRFSLDLTLMFLCSSAISDFIITVHFSGDLEMFVPQILCFCLILKNLKLYIEKKSS